jgi:hypothetical protein
MEGALMEPGVVMINAVLADGRELDLAETISRRGKGSAHTEPYAIVTYAATVDGNQIRWGLRLDGPSLLARSDEELRAIAREKLKGWLSECELQPGARLWHRRFEEYV